MDPGFVQLGQLLADLRRGGFRELSGSRIEADLAIPEPLVNRVVAALLAEARGHVRSADIRIEPGDRFHVTLQLARSFVPSIGLEVTIDRQPELPASPVVVLKWRTLLPGLSTFAGMAASFLKVLPPGVRLEGDRVWLDLPPLAARAGAGDLLPLVSELRISTRGGVIDLRVVLTGGRVS